MVLAAGLAIWFCGGPAAACRLALVLALDISASVDATEDRLQRQGLARALLAPEVQAAILSTADPVALSVFEWSGRDQQDMILPWMLLDNPASLQAAAARIGDSRRSYADFSTAVGQMLVHSDRLFAQAPACAARTLDVSGDGINNDGPDPAEIYAQGRLAGVTVNALAIVVAPGDAPDHADEGAPQGLAAWYTQALIKGPGAFVEVAEGFAGFERAMRRKLVRETAVQIGMGGATDNATGQRHAGPHHAVPHHAGPHHAVPYRPAPDPRSKPAKATVQAAITRVP